MTSDVKKKANIIVGEIGDESRARSQIKERKAILKTVWWQYLVVKAISRSIRTSIIVSTKTCHETMFRLGHHSLNHRQRGRERYSKTCRAYARACMRFRQNRLNQQEDAVLLRMSPDIFPTRRQVPGSRIRLSSWVCIICDDAVTSRDHATSVTMMTVIPNMQYSFGIAMNTSGTTLHNTFTTKRSFCENTAMKTFLVLQYIRCKNVPWS